VFADLKLANLIPETLAARDISSDIALANDENWRKPTKVGATRRTRETIAAPRCGRKTAESLAFRRTGSKIPTLSARFRSFVFTH
jgi:hypothetical protein